MGAAFAMTVQMVASREESKGSEISQDGNHGAIEGPDKRNKKLATKIYVNEGGELETKTITMSVNGVDEKIAQAYIESIEKGWSELGVDIELVDSGGDLMLLPCEPLVCTTTNANGDPLGAASVGGQKMLYGKGQLETTPAHEFGHILGLQHGGRPGGIMTTGYGFQRRVVTSSDLLRVRSLYE